MLAFEPFDHGPIFTALTGAATIGGIVAAGVAGSRRLTAGGTRDYVLGFSGASGRGERFTAGAKVIKNVTGYDLPKIVTGSWGRLVALTEITLKVLPAPLESATRVIRNLSPPEAYKAMARALGSHAHVATAAYIPAPVGGVASITAFRVEGFDASVAARCAMLASLAGATGAVGSLAPTEADALWQDLRTLASLERLPPLAPGVSPPCLGPRSSKRSLLVNIGGWQTGQAVYCGWHGTEIRRDCGRSPWPPAATQRSSGPMQRCGRKSRRFILKLLLILIKNSAFAALSIRQVCLRRDDFWTLAMQLILASRKCPTPTWLRQRGSSANACIADFVRQRVQPMCYLVTSWTVLAVASIS